MCGITAAEGGFACRTPVAKVSIKNTFWEVSVVGEAAHDIAGDGLRRSNSCPSLHTSVGEDASSDDSSTYSLYMSNSWADLSELDEDDHQLGAWQRSGRPTGQAKRAPQADEKKPSAASAATAGEHVEEKKPKRTPLCASARPFVAGSPGVAAASPCQWQPGYLPVALAALFPPQTQQACNSNIGLPLGVCAPEAPACCTAAGTSLMMKDMPTYYTEEMLMQVLNLKGFVGKCVSMYLPLLKLREGAMSRNMGLAILDFATPQDAALARVALHGHVWAGAVDDEELVAQVVDATVRANACGMHLGLSAAADGSTGADPLLDWLDIPAPRQAWPPACCRESTPSLSPERSRPAAHWPHLGGYPLGA